MILGIGVDGAARGETVNFFNGWISDIFVPTPSVPLSMSGAQSAAVIPWHLITTNDKQWARVESCKCHVKTIENRQGSAVKVWRAALNCKDANFNN